MTHIHDGKTPLVFITGPVRGASNAWRERAARLIVSKRKNVSVAFTDFHSHEELPDGVLSPLDWGFHHLDIALTNGAVLIWFPTQNYRVQGKASHLHDHSYGWNAAVDFGMCLQYKRHHPEARIVVGYEKAYDRRVAVFDRVTLRAGSIPLIEGGIENVVDELLAIMN
jgi:hypothetical protein